MKADSEDDSFEVVDHKRLAELQKVVRDQQTTITQLEEESARRAALLVKAADNRKEKHEKGQSGWNIIDVVSWFTFLDFSVALCSFGYFINTTNFVFCAFALASALVDIVVLAEAKTSSMKKNMHYYLLFVASRYVLFLLSPTHSPPLALGILSFITGAQVAVILCCIYGSDRLNKHFYEYLQENMNDEVQEIEKEEDYEADNHLFPLTFACFLGILLLIPANR